jgi:AhpD family alkylhydroperoxidase
MKQRIEVEKVVPEAVKVLMPLERQVNKSGLGESLLNFVRLRASQINGCAYCIDMHSKDLRAMGETEQRIYELDAWRETPFYSERERAALAWTEAVTLISETHAPDEVYDEARKYFSESELVNLTLAVIAINSWNRLSISFRKTPGTYQPARKASGGEQAA